MIIGISHKNFKTLQPIEVELCQKKPTYTIKIDIQYMKTLNLKMLYQLKLLLFFHICTTFGIKNKIFDPPKCLSI